MNFFWSSFFELPAPVTKPLTYRVWDMFSAYRPKPYVLTDCEQSRSFPSPLEITEFFSWRARNNWNMRSIPIIPFSVLTLVCINIF